MGYVEAFLIFISGALFLLTICYLAAYLFRSPYWIAKVIQGSVVTQVNLGVITLSTATGIGIIEPDAQYISMFYKHYPYFSGKIVGVVLGVAGAGQLVAQWAPLRLRICTLVLGYLAWFLLAMYGLPLANIRMLFWLSLGQCLAYGFLLVVLVVYAREVHRGSR